MLFLFSASGMAISVTTLALFAFTSTATTSASVLPADWPPANNSIPHTVEGSAHLPQTVVTFANNSDEFARRSGTETPEVNFDDLVEEDEVVGRKSQCRPGHFCHLDLPPTTLKPSTSKPARDVNHPVELDAVKEHRLSK